MPPSLDAYLYFSGSADVSSTYITGPQEKMLSTDKSKTRSHFAYLYAFPHDRIVVVLLAYSSEQFARNTMRGVLSQLWPAGHRRSDHRIKERRHWTLLPPADCRFRGQWHPYLVVPI